MKNSNQRREERIKPAGRRFRFKDEMANVGDGGMFAGGGGEQGEVRREER